MASTCRHPWWRRGLLVLTVATVLSLFCPGAPLSRLTLTEDSERQRLLSENEQRLDRSQLFLEQYRTKKHVFSVPATRPTGADVGITVLTMARGRRMTKKRLTYRTQYLTQSVAAVLQLLNETSLRRSYQLHVCNVDDRPELFAEAKRLEDIVPFFKRYGVKSGMSRRLSKTTMWEKLKMDYVFCLQQTLAQGVKYAMLVEDDAVAHNDLLRVVEHVLDTVVEAPGARPVAYLKLYHPLRLLGYLSFEVERLIELLALSLCLGSALAFASWAYSQRGSVQHGAKDSENGRALKSWAGWAMVVAVLALAIGRTNLLQLRRLSPHLYQLTPTPSCCIPAVMYTRAGGIDFARYLLNVTCTAYRSTDIRMDEFREITGWRGLLVQPNLFSHIGLLSSLRTKEVNPLIVQ